MEPQVFDFGIYIKGDTLYPKVIEISTSNGATPPVYTPVNITGCTVLMSFKETTDSAAVLTLSTTNGKITLTDPVNGKFQLSNERLTMNAGTYGYDIEVQYPNGDRRTYLRGTIIIQDGYSG